MKRIISITLTALFASAVLFAGGSGETGKTGKTVINYYTWEALEDSNPIIEQFNRENPDIEVVLHIVPDNPDTQVKLDVMMMGSSDIDVVQIADGQQFAKAKNGLLRNIDDYIRRDGIDMKANFGGAEEWAKFEGSYYVYPRHNSVGCVFYNKTMFDSLGIPYPKDDWTYAEYIALAERLTHGSGSNKVYGTFNHIRPGFWCLTALQKADFYTSDGMANINAEPFVNDLRNRMHLDSSGYEKNYSEIIATNTLQNIEFFNKKCAMVMAASWMVRDMKNKEKYPYDFEVGVAHFPRYDGTIAPKTSWGSVSALAIPTTSKNPDAAWRFIRYYIEKGSLEIAKTGTVPVYLPAYNREMIAAFGEGSGLPQGDIEKFFDPEIVSIMKMPVGEAMNEYNSIIQEETSLFFTNAKSLEQTVRDMKSRVDKAILDERSQKK
ncbi:ABC transporter substrate-binding protein [Breznakiella homolactica]|uniref:Extracellular solute-binding protein n=1 Tax=Breznakiella homolactica TaxID=2798577 RepID=A0A7T8BAU5_9SPIR|nr:extracellular solute-binding protein [Breznakiella homolactica]QQO09380.1 extracellular solute-binding protein [Breznakiella homolactica]